MSKFVEDTIEIDAPAARVWTILTDSSFIQQYMFGCVAETDWQPGSSLLWKGAGDGHLYVKGEVVAIDAPHRLEYTVLGADMAIADVPENYLTIIYNLRENSRNATELRVAMGDFDAVGNGQARYEETMASGGWAPMLAKVKQLAEV